MVIHPVLVSFTIKTLGRFCENYRWSWFHCHLRECMSMNLQKYLKWRKLIQTSSKVSLFSAPAALRSHPRLVDLPFSFHMFRNSHFEVNAELEALLIPSPRRFPRCIPAPMCVYSPRPENQKRNWQVRGAIKVCGAAQKYITLFFCSITHRAPC